MSVEELEAEIRKLPEAEQAEIIAFLLESSSADDDSEVDLAWAKESAERMRALQAGETTARPVKEAIADIRAKTNAPT